MAAMLVCALAIPEAFEHDAWQFAGAYLVVRVLHIALFVAGTDHVDVRLPPSTLAPTALLAPAVLLVSAGLDGAAQSCCGSPPSASTTSAARCGASRAGGCRPRTSPSGTG